LDIENSRTREPENSDDGKLLELYETTVRREWLDYNGHLNAGYYAVAFNFAFEAFLRHMGIGKQHVLSGGGTTYALECHITYLRELKEGEPIHFTLQMLDLDEKKFHFFIRMRQSQHGFLAATYEQISIYVDPETRRSAPMPAKLYANFAGLRKAHLGIPVPKEVGRTIGIRTRGLEDSRDQ
jgi:acyl-CoA thioester hydrolase